MIACGLQQAALRIELAAQHQHALCAALEAQGARLAAEHDAIHQVHGAGSVIRLLFGPLCRPTGATGWAGVCLA